MDRLKRLLNPLLRVTYQPLMRATRGLTLGVRCAVIDAEGRVLLVRHSYSPGWTFPGGGVERGETALRALERELREETGVELTGPVELVGVFANFAPFPGDHVLFYVARDWRQAAEPRPGVEIVERRFFAPGDLPENIAPGARRRLAELFARAAASPDW